MVFALGALGIVSVMNMIGVKVFGEMEFWFSLVKVGTLAVFLAVGAVFLASGHPVAGQMPGLHLVADHGGIFPHGILPAVLIVQGVVFAYASIEPRRRRGGRDGRCAQGLAESHQQRDVAHRAVLRDRSCC